MPLTGAQLVFVFGATEALKREDVMGEIREREIAGVEVEDGSVVATAVEFEHTKVAVARVELSEARGSAEAGERLARELPLEMESGERLHHVIVLSDGLKANGSQLVEAMTKGLPASVTVTGGLAGDGARFAETAVLWEGKAAAGAVVAVGLYGGGDPFGPERRITKARANVLYELDGQSALMLYKKYLGDQAKDLPGSGLLFPLSLRIDGVESGLVRTILMVDEEEQSITFAGDMPEGAYARLMKANFDRLIDGAGSAAESSRVNGTTKAPELAVLISCVGRKLLLKQRIEEEVEAVRDALGGETVMTGFYSYGEISPCVRGGRSELHNQTMTVIHLTEH
jgi:hypothetical protein